MSGEEIIVSVELGKRHGVRGYKQVDRSTSTVNEYTALTAVHLSKVIVAAKVGTVPVVGTSPGLRGTLKSSMTVSLARFRNVP